MFSMRSLAELTSHAALVPDDPALLDGTDAVSYGELDLLTGRLAAAIGDLGVAPGDRVGVLMRKSVWSFATVHAVLRAGAVMVPIDPFAPTAHIVSVLVDAGVAVIVTDVRLEALRAVAEAAGLDAVVTRTAVGDELEPLRIVEWSQLADFHARAPVERRVDDDAYIIYTSGSTGRPKGIVHTHASALAYARIAATEYGVRANDRLTNIAGLHFDQSTFELYVAPLVGASVLVVPDAVLRFPASLSELVERARCTIWYSVPYVLRQLVTRGALETRDLSSIRFVLYGGEAYPPDELAALMVALPNATISNVYGPAEVNQCTRHDLVALPATLQEVPIGRAWPETELAVVDPGGAVTDGRGELLVATSTMMDRYWNRPDLTRAAIVEQHDGSGALRRWYRTGDLVEPDSNGDLVFVGRVDNQVKIRGQRVELEAVDATIRALHAVAEVACVVRTDERGERGVVALVEPANADGVDPDEVRQAVRDRHRAVAVPVVVAIVERLPRTGTGKVDRIAASALLVSEVDD